MIARTSRRHFLAASLGALTSTRPSAATARAPHILLRSSWQTVNIGDIAHTPGVLTLLERHVPEATVTLWPTRVDSGVHAMLRKRFPRVQMALTTESQQQAMATADFLLHGSGPYLVAAKHVDLWKKTTGKPYGVYGITLSPPIADAAASFASTVELLSGARFVYFRDSRSLALAKEQGCRSPIMEFGPDGAFAVDLANDEAADAFLKSNGLERGKFLCCIPRLRHSPYWKMKKGVAFDAAKHERNEAMKDHDIGPLREAIEEVVSKSEMKVLICPEDSSQVELGRAEIYDRLSSQARARVVWKDRYWLTDEAISTYRLSAGLFGLEMHSPIMCIGNGVPAIVCRFAEQTSKGFMWEDIGLGDWLFDTDDEAQRANISARVLTLAQDPTAARAKAAAARATVEKRQEQTMRQLRRELGLNV
jgi:polysaccharide pyruvyl transferase WcaK-like protein